MWNCNSFPVSDCSSTHSIGPSKADQQQQTIWKVPKLGTKTSVVEWFWSLLDIDFPFGVRQPTDRALLSLSGSTLVNACLIQPCSIQKYHDCPPKSTSTRHPQKVQRDHQIRGKTSTRRCQSLMCSSTPPVMSQKNLPKVVKPLGPAKIWWENKTSWMCTGPHEIAQMHSRRPPPHLHPRPPNTSKNPHSKKQHSYKNM